MLVADSQWSSLPIYKTEMAAGPGILTLEPSLQGVESLTWLVVAAAGRDSMVYQEMGTPADRWQEHWLFILRVWGFVFYLLGRSHVKRVTSPDLMLPYSCKMGILTLHRTVLRMTLFYLETPGMEEVHWRMLSLPRFILSFTNHVVSIFVVFKLCFWR